MQSVGGDGNRPALQSMCGRLRPLIILRDLAVAIIYGRFASVRTGSARPYEKLGGLSIT